MQIFPTAYFPSIHYLRALLQATDAQIEWHEHFQKQTIRTRCEILSANGILRLSIPIQHESGQKFPLCELRIDHTGTWKNDHWRAITSAYALAPYFEDYAAEIKEIIYAPDEFLWQKNQRCLALLEDVLDAPIQVRFTDSYIGVDGPTSKSAYLERDSLGLSDYQQVFSYGKSFTPNLSMIDVLLNEGPFIRKWILASKDESVSRL